MAHRDLASPRLASSHSAFSFAASLPRREGEGDIIAAPKTALKSSAAAV